MITQPASFPQAEPTASVLLVWYDRHRRVLPWRVLPGETADPYRVWLSEIMLQQTTVQAVKPYFEAFIRRWTTVEQLASASSDDIMKMWAGLGYYSRARNLHACAKVVVARFGGQFPADEASLLTLPGVGDYTAAAISSIAFGRRAVVIDGNVERVIARLHKVETAMPEARKPIWKLADSITPQERPGDFAQAMMDLGATVCTPRNPSCGICPFLGMCQAQRHGAPETLPRKRPKPPKATRYGAAFVAVRADGALLVRTRPPKGLLGGMTEVPGTDWMPVRMDFDPLVSAPLPRPWTRQSETVRHVFTHFPLELTVFTAKVPAGTAAPLNMRWISANAIAGEAFPTLFRKVLAVGNAATAGESPRDVG